MNKIASLNKKYFKQILVRKSSLFWNTELAFKSQVSLFSWLSNSYLDQYSSVGRVITLINAKIGDFFSFSWNFGIGATAHKCDSLSLHAFPYVKDFAISDKSERIKIETIVGHDVWIGAGAIIMPGVKVGNGAVVGAGAIVTKDIEPYSVVIGAPVKFKNYRFSAEKINEIQELEWWNWSSDKLKKNLTLFKSQVNEMNIQDLLK